VQEPDYLAKEILQPPRAAKAERSQAGPRPGTSRASPTMKTVEKDQGDRVTREEAPRWTRCPVSLYFVISRRGIRGPELFHISSECGAELLPVLSSRDAAQNFALHHALGPGWYAKECSAGELVSLLLGPYSNTEWVLLDPLPLRPPAKLVPRNSFISQLLGQRV